MLSCNFRKPGGKNSANGGSGDKGMPENAHIFQEYTYKKITPCDICSQILRGKLNKTIYNAYLGPYS